MYPDTEAGIRACTLQLMNTPRPWDPEDQDIQWLLDKIANEPWAVLEEAALYIRRLAALQLDRDPETFAERRISIEYAATAPPFFVSVAMQILVGTNCESCRAEFKRQVQGIPTPEAYLNVHAGAFSALAEICQSLLDNTAKVEIPEPFKPKPFIPPV